jgi:hypothetical protein
MASGVEFNLRTNIREFSSGLRGLARDQIPFASARMLTAVAREVAKAETAALSSTVKSPTPFTLRAFGVQGASKTNLTARVFTRDIQAAYLEPFLNPAGGQQVLGSKRAILLPIEIALDQYGNIPRGALKSFKGRPGVFIGSVKTKGGKLIYGLWQRPTRPETIHGKRAMRLANTTGHLVLLVRFTQPALIKGHNLDFVGRANKTIAASAPAAWDAAINDALATAR